MVVIAHIAADPSISPGGANLQSRGSLGPRESSRILGNTGYKKTDKTKLLIVLYTIF